MKKCSPAACWPCRLWRLSPLQAHGANPGAGLARPSSMRWLVPYAAGGGSDFLARTIGQPLSTPGRASR